MKPKISIIIATLNSGKTLKQTLDSIRHQTYKNIELIINRYGKFFFAGKGTK